MLPVLAQIGPVTIYTHDFFTIAGLLVGLVWYYRSLLRDRILDQRIVLISLSALLGGVLGAHLLTSWEALGAVSAAGMPPTAILTHGPRSIIGGFVGGYVGVILAKRSLGYTLSTGDHYAAAIPLGLAIGRIGCFLSELPLGTPTTLPWAAHTALGRDRREGLFSSDEDRGAESPRSARVGCREQEQRHPDHRGDR